MGWRLASGSHLPDPVLPLPGRVHSRGLAALWVWLPSTGCISCSSCLSVHLGAENGPWWGICAKDSAGAPIRAFPQRRPTCTARPGCTCLPRGISAQVPRDRGGQASCIQSVNLHVLSRASVAPCSLSTPVISSAAERNLPPASPDLCPRPRAHRRP